MPSCIIYYFAIGQTTGKTQNLRMGALREDLSPVPRVSRVSSESAMSLASLDERYFGRQE